MPESAVPESAATESSTDEPGPNADEGSAGADPGSDPEARAGPEPRDTPP